MRWTWLRLVTFIALGSCCATLAGAATPERTLARQIDAYLQPYVQTGNFSGVALVKRNGRVLFKKAYGFANRERGVRNKPDTRFHIASVSMQFTAAATLRLIDQGSLSLDSHVGEYVHGIAGAENITVRDLLTERSGLPDINSLPDYNEILRHHQTPSTLIEKISGQALLFPAGSKFLHEEHSAYNLLALILEKKTGLKFADAMQRLLIWPARLKSSGMDDDSAADLPNMAAGYEPEGVSGLKRTTLIHWSAKSGNASAYTTADDQAKLVESIFAGQLLSASSLQAVLDSSQRVGFGWFRGQSTRFNEMAYSMNGRAPGFSSFVLYLPKQHLTVVVLSNIYSSATTSVGYDIAASTLGLPYTAFQPSRSAPDAANLKACAGTFQFGSEFYQPDAKVTLIAQGSELNLRWPSGDISALIPLESDHFIDRSYWEEVKVERDAAGQPAVLHYGRFQGTLTKAVP